VRHRVPHMLEHMYTQFQPAQTSTSAGPSGM